jgi:hypothetical protein
MAVLKIRFGTKAFGVAWAKHWPQTKPWDAFVAGMRTAAGDPKYPEQQIENRIEKFKRELKGSGRKTPKYPKRRVPSVVGIAGDLGW